MRKKKKNVRQKDRERGYSHSTFDLADTEVIKIHKKPVLAQFPGQKPLDIYPKLTQP